MSSRFSRARSAALLGWTGLLLALATWHLNAHAGAAAVALLVLTVLPLLPPLPGLWAGRRRTYRWAPLTLAPALAWSLTEIVANPTSRGPAVLVGLLCVFALAAVVAALRTMPAGG